MTLLETARAHGVRVIRGKLVDVDVAGGRVRSVRIDSGGALRSLAASHLVISAGPMQKETARLIGIDLPILAERHRKASFPDPLGTMRSAPMLIWLDEQHLPWTEAERAALAESEEMQWLLGRFPAGVHGRPEGGCGSGSVLVLFNHHHDPCEPVFPPPDEEHYAEIALRGMATMVPGLAAYIGKGARPYVDGGYYMKTRENRPLIGPLPVDGAYITGALSGFGVMAACAAGELIGLHIAERPLPDYAPAFLLSRYEDAGYCARLENWGDGGQL
jgi:glycine/D-amino acid oxidase-like deaminating enzyme